MRFSIGSFVVVLLLLAMQALGGGTYAESQKEFTIKVIDAHTLMPIRSAVVRVRIGNLEIGTKLDLIGNQVVDLDAGKSRFMITANGYRDLDTVIPVSADRKVYVFAMQKIMTEDSDLSFSVKESGNVVSLDVRDLKPPVVNEEEPAIDTVDTSGIELLLPKSEVVAKDTIAFVPAREEQTVVPTTTPEPEKEFVPSTVMQPKPKDSIFEEYTGSKNDLPVDEYRPNNIVFLIDKSGSMSGEGRFELLKKSILKMVDMLRPIDVISAVGYGSDFELLFTGVEGDDKKSIELGLKDMKPSGSSETGKGLKEAYRIAKEDFIPGGNNLIILATDGEIAITAAMKQLILQNLKEGVRLSVFGIKNDVWTEVSMRELAAIGGGDYLNMRKARKVEQLLIDEIKDKSLIRK